MTNFHDNKSADLAEPCFGDTVSNQRDCFWMDIYIYYITSQQLLLPYTKYLSSRRWVSCALELSKNGIIFAPTCADQFHPTKPERS